MSLLATIKTGAFVVKNIVVKNFPKIAVGIGTISVIAGGIDACHQTLKAPVLIEEHNKKMKQIHEAIELSEAGSIEYDDSIRRRDVFTAYASTTFKFAKVYWRPIVLVGLGFTSIFGGFGVLNARHAAALGAFTTLSDQFNDYRANVIQEYGEDADRRLAGEVSNTLPYTIVEESEDGSSKEIEVNAVDLRSVTNDTFTFDFNYKVPSWDDGSYLFVENYIEQTKLVLTHKLQHRTDHITAFDVAREFKFDKVPENKSKMAKAMFYGWVNRPGATVDISYVPYVEAFSADETTDQFPMLIPIDVTNDDQFEWFRHMYITDNTKVGYIVKFNVDCDENGIPDEIYTKIYGED